MKYVPVFTVAKVNVLPSENLLRSSYGPMGMICTVENEAWTALLPEPTLNRLAEETHNKVFDSTFLSTYLANAQNVIAALKPLIAQKDKLSMLSKEELFQCLERFAEWCAKFFNLYNQTEFFCFTKIEDELRKYVPDPNVLSELLSDKPLPPELPERVKQLVSLIREIQKARWKLREASNQAYMGDSIFVALVMEISKRTKRTDIDCLTINEIKDVLDGKKVPEAEHRRTALVISWNNGIRLETGAKAEAKIKELMKIEVKEELKGTIASPGKVQGRIRIIPLTIDPAPFLAKMKKGEILVAPTTGPEMMTAIQKASAIITDEGGLMSHAAVVSRELKIPCIVGTRYATKLLKDGDLVEVDANNGIVRKTS